METYIQRSFTDYPSRDYGFKITTGSPSNNHSLAVNCNSQFSFQYNVPALCLCVLCFVTGLVYSFFGYRFYKAVLFVTGLLFGSVLIYMICDKEKLLPTLGKAGVSICAGVLFGVVTMLVEYVGVFMSGFLSGLFVGLAIMLGLYFLSPPSSLWLTIGVLFMSGLVLALVTLQWKKLFLIMGTALIGGAIVAGSLDYVAHRFGVSKWAWTVLVVDSLHRHSGICWYGWMVLSMWPLVFILGTVVQWNLTGVNFTRKNKDVKMLFSGQEKPQ